MNGGHADWVRKKNELVAAIKHLGFPAALGEQVAANLGGIKAMDRMIAYLSYVKPNKAELIVDEMLAICSDIDAWHKKKDSQEANAAYTDWLEYGTDGDDEGDF